MPGALSNYEYELWSGLEFARCSSLSDKMWKGARALVRNEVALSSADAKLYGEGTPRCCRNI